MEPSADEKHGASFLDLPPELRLQVYELAFDNFQSTVKYDDRGGREADMSTVRGATALVRVSKMIRHETLPLVPTVDNITFELCFTKRASMKAWLRRMGPYAVGQLHQLVLYGEGTCWDAHGDDFDMDRECRDKHPEFDHPECDTCHNRCWRRIAIDLSAPDARLASDDPFDLSAAEYAWRAPGIKWQLCSNLSSSCNYNNLGWLDDAYLKCGRPPLRAEGLMSIWRVLQGDGRDALKGVKIFACA